MTALLLVLFYSKDVFGYSYSRDSQFYNAAGEPTDLARMYTVTFQTFVMMQLINQINARKLKENELNVFKGIFENAWFVGISLLTIAIQLSIIYIGGRPLRCVPLTLNEELFCITIAVGMLPWALLAKVVPASWFDKLTASVDDRPMETEEVAASNIFTQSGRLSRSLR